ncbi:MAG: hypothetical protein WC900_03200 [Oscillospiraceae bacterium]|jgi:hypothetical protein
MSLSFAPIASASNIETEILSLKDNIDKYESAIQGFQQRAQEAEENADYLKKVDTDSTALISDVCNAITCDGMQQGVTCKLSNVGANIYKRGYNAYQIADPQIQEIRQIIEYKRDEIRELEIKLEMLRSTI